LKKSFLRKSAIDCQYVTKTKKYDFRLYQVDSLLLEWKIVCTACLSRSSRSSRSWRERSSGSSCRSSCYRSTCWWERSTSWLHSASHGSNSIRIYVLNIPCTNIIKPAAIIFVSIDIKGYQDLFAALNIKLCQAFSSEDIEDQLLGILLMSLNDKRL